MAEPNYFKVIRPSTATGSVTVKFAPGTGQSTFQVQYRMDGAGDWTPCVGVAVTVSAGHYCEFKGSNSVFYYSSTDNLQCQFSFGRTGSGNFEIAGDITTLLNGTGGLTSLAGHDYCFRKFFKYASSAGKMKIDNLLLPSTVLSKGCYEEMFTYVSGSMGHGDDYADGGMITLPATTLAEDAYKEMFANTQLVYMKASAASNQLNATNSAGWLDVASESGTFESTDPDFDTTIQRSADTVPSGWTLTKPTKANYLKLYFPATNKGVFSIDILHLPVAPACVVQARRVGDDNWISIVSYSITGFPGDTIEIRGAETNTVMGKAATQIQCNVLEFQANEAGDEVKVYGDITSLLNGVGGLTDLTGRNWAFSNFFIKNSNSKDFKLDCSELEMTSTTLASSCYYNLFAGVASALVKAPYLPAETLTTNAYQFMFNRCINIDYIKAAVGSDQLSETNSSGWLNGVAAQIGVFHSTNPDFDEDIERSINTVPFGWTIRLPLVGFYLNTKKVNFLFINGKQVAELYLNGKKVGYEAPEPPGPDPKLTNFRITNIGNATDNPDDTWAVKVKLPSQCDMQVYRSDSGNDETLTPGETTTLTLPYGEYLEFWGNNEHGLYPVDNYTNIICPESGSYEASGQLSSLAMQDAKEGYTFELLFSGNKGLTKADNLVIPDGYDGTTETFSTMFYHCYNLVKGPENIPQANGNNMFYLLFNGCSSLTSVGVDWTQWPTGSMATQDWLENVSASGTFKCPAALTIPSRDENGVPEGWTITHT